MPKKVARARKDEHVRATDEDEEMLLLDQKPGPSTQRPATQTQTSPARTRTKKPAADDSGSETEEEPEEDEELLLDAQSRARDRARAGKALPTPSPERDVDMDVNAGIDRMCAPGRIVGASFPLADFRANIARGDVVSKAVEDLAFVVKDVVVRPFATRRTEEMLECMRELRKVALEVRRFRVSGYKQY